MTDPRLSEQAPSRPSQRGRAPHRGLSAFVKVVGSAGGMLFGALLIDHFLTGSVLTPHDKGSVDALGSLGEIMAAVLGLTITVVAIVLQLASQRYSPKIVDLFLKDRVNINVLGFMVVSCVYVVLLPAFAEPGATPHVAVWLGLGLAMISFGLLLPYFGHVFEFLQPTNFITQIETVAQHSLESAVAGVEETDEAQRQVSDAVERIADNCLSALSQTDRGLALHSIRTLEHMLGHYLTVKRTLPKGWARISRDRFLSVSNESYQEIVERGTWLESQVLMEFEHVLRRSLAPMGEVVSQIASSTRSVGRAALENDEDQVLELVVRFFNTYIRHALNERNVRAIYNILYQYQRLTVDLMVSKPELCRQIVQYLVYYGRLANDMGMPFVTVTAAHDVRVICERAFLSEGVDVLPLLDLFLTLDQPGEGKTEELALMGVRKAQSILGAFFSEHAAPQMVQRIRHDMGHESVIRLTRIRDAILVVDAPKFWEVTDRGINFDYVEPHRHGAIRAFFEPLIDTADC